MENGILYEQVARIGKALSSPKRLEMLNLLAQGEKTVDVLAGALKIDIKLTSAHLKVLKDARMVTSMRDGKFMIYRISGTDVADLWVTLRLVAEQHLQELRQALGAMMAEDASLAGLNRNEFVARAERGEVIVIDVRPSAEYTAGHLPYARSLPLDELEARLSELPLEHEIVAYCRGPFCVMASQAVAALSARGYRIHALREGVNEWRMAGMPLESD